MRTSRLLNAAGGGAHAGGSPGKIKHRKTRLIRHIRNNVVWVDLGFIAGNSLVAGSVSEVGC